MPGPRCNPARWAGCRFWAGSGRSSRTCRRGACSVISGNRSTWPSRSPSGRCRSGRRINWCWRSAIPPIACWPRGSRKSGSSSAMAPHSIAIAKRCPMSCQNSHRRSARMAQALRNNLEIYDDVAAQWWSDDIRWVRTLRNMVPGRLGWFDRHIDWPGKDVLDLGCAGGFMAEALDDRGAHVTGIDPAQEAIAAARAHADAAGRAIRYDVGVGEALPYCDTSFDAVVCVDVLEHVQSLPGVIAEVSRVLRPGGLFLFDTINRNAVARFATITMAENMLRLLPKGTHDPALFIKPAELRTALLTAGFTTGKMTGLGPRGIDKRGDFTFGRLPGTMIIYMGTARKPDRKGA